jgi:hypothetical protein
LILANYHTQMVEKDGDVWETSKLAVCHFSKLDWFHTVVLCAEAFQLKRYDVDNATPITTSIPLWNLMVAIAGWMRMNLPKIALYINIL